MQIRTTYVCDGAIYCGFKPNGVTVIEERQVLYPENGYTLVRKSDNQQVEPVWLKDGDSEENYIEIKIKENENGSDFMD